MLRRAGAEHALGGRYSALIRDLAARDYGLPATLSVEAATARLDQIPGRTQRFSDLVQRAGQARDNAALLGATQDLDQWRRRI
ncbi:MAG: hypothetical protein KGJ05_09740, partial [Alphaproteobacteria bacterium]|nr:hypothetical protein [Alphaproteobacteria bacterium]